MNIEPRFIKKKIKLRVFANPYTTYWIHSDHFETFTLGKLVEFMKITVCRGAVHLPLDSLMSVITWSGPKLRLSLFPQTLPTPKKLPYPNYFIAIFCQDFFLIFKTTFFSFLIMLFTIFYVFPGKIFSQPTYLPKARR